MASELQGASAHQWVAKDGCEVGHGVLAMSTRARGLAQGAVDGDEVPRRRMQPAKGCRMRSTSWRRRCRARLGWRESAVAGSR